MAVRIVVDSSAGVPADIVKALDITVVDLHILPSPEGEKESAGGAGTAGLNALELTACYARQLERGGDEGVVALHLPPGLSSTFEAATTAAALFDGLVRVIPTSSVGMATGAAAMAAARLARDGASLDECEKIATSTLARSHTWVYLHTLDSLRRSGRVSATTAVLSSALGARPIMALDDGRLGVVAKTRTPTKACAKLAELVQEEAHGAPAFVAIQHVGARDRAERLEELLRSVMPEGASVLVVDMPEALAVHCGQGAMGVSMVAGELSPGSR